MRWLSSIGALLVAAAVGGCAIIEAEKDNRGGFLDQAADDLWMKADSKKMRALRAVAIEASLARIAMITPKSAPDRALLARRIGETTKRADVVRRCAFTELPEPCFFFDSVMVDYENALFDLALVALPIDDARTLLTRVSGGVASVAINPLELVQTLLDIGREAFRVGRVVGAIYRDTLELEVQVWLASPDLADEVARLRAVYARGNDNIPAWRAEIAALRAQGLEPVPDPRFITKIFAILTYICGQIVTENDPAFEECKQSAILRSLPAASGGRPLFGSGPIVVGGGQTQTGRRAATADDKAGGKRQVAVIEPKEEYNEILDPYDPRSHTRPYVISLQKALCVPATEHGSVGIFTKNQIAIFENGVRGSMVNGKLDSRERDALLALKGNPCVKDGPQNFFERRTYTDAAALDELVRQLNKIEAGGTLQTTTLGGARKKIAAVRAKLMADRRLELDLVGSFSDHVTKDLIDALN